MGFPRKNGKLDFAAFEKLCLADKRAAAKEIGTSGSKADKASFEAYIARKKANNATARAATEKEIKTLTMKRDKIVAKGVADATSKITGKKRKNDTPCRCVIS